MTDIYEAWQAGVDAVVADNGLSRAGFRNALQSVITDGFTNAEGNAFVDAVAAEFNRLGLINNPTYNNLRGNVIADSVLHMELFRAIGTIPGLPESEPAIESARLTELRDERDEINNAIQRLDDLIAAEPPGTVGRLVKEIFRDGKRLLREQRERLRDEIRNITGDPDA